MEGVKLPRFSTTNVTSEATRVLLDSLPKNRVQALGVVYSRSIEFRDTILRLGRPTADELRPEGLQYMCYQHHIYRIDVTELVKRCKSVLVFSITQHRIRHFFTPGEGYQCSIQL
jgi:hypothetical protein